MAEGTPSMPVGNVADSEPHEECDYSPDWIMVGKAKKGGVKWVSTPHVKRIDNTCLPP